MKNKLSYKRFLPALNRQAFPQRRNLNIPLNFQHSLSILLFLLKRMIIFDK